MEVNNVSVRVPERWDDITLGDYETYYKEKPETARQRVELVAKIVKIEPVHLLEWPAEVFNFIVNTISFVFENAPAEASPVIDIDGVKFMVNMEDKQPLGAWVDAEEAQKSDTAVLSSVLSIVCRPIGEAYDFEVSEQRQKIFAALPMTKVLGLLAFFLQCSRALEARTEAYTKLVETVGLLPPSIRPLLRRGDGIKPLRIYQTIKYKILMRSLNYQLRKLSRLYSTSATSK